MNKAQFMSLLRGLFKTGAGALAAHGITQTSVTAQLTQVASAVVTFLVAQAFSHGAHSDSTADAPPSTPGTIGGALKLAFILAIPALVFFTPGCKQTLAPGGAYSTIDTNTGQALGPFVFGIDKTLVDSKDALTAFLTWELQQRGSLTGGLHSITVAADKIRIQAPLWFTNAYNLRSNYLWIVANAPSLAPGASNNLQSAATLLSTQATTAQALQTTH